VGSTSQGGTDLGLDCPVSRPSRAAVLVGRHSHFQAHVTLVCCCPGPLHNWGPTLDWREDQAFFSSVHMSSPIRGKPKHQTRAYSPSYLDLPPMLRVDSLFSFYIPRTPADLPRQGGKPPQNKWMNEKCAACILGHLLHSLLASANQGN
jgi:hypothetical protein